MILVFSKKSILFYVFLTTAVFISFYAYSAYSTKKAPVLVANTVILDPGHGGMDGGAIGKEGSLEKELNLSVALKTRQKLLDEGFNVVMTRETDISLHNENESKNKKRSDLNNRLKTVKKFENGILLSIHMNSFASSKEKGLQIFYSPNNPESKKLAKILEADFKELVDSENRRESKVSKDEIFLLKHSKIPSCLIECGFLSNPGEEKLLKTEEYQQKIANSIVISIKKYVSCN